MKLSWSVLTLQRPFPLIIVKRAVSCSIERTSISLSANRAAMSKIGTSDPMTDAVCTMGQAPGG